MEKMEKGEEIRFVKGTYAGLAGWKNKAKKRAKGSMIPVIVQLERGLKPTMVKLSSFRKAFTEPTSKEEAAVQQNPDLELAMINLATMWAQMGLTDISNIVKLLATEINEAQKHQKNLKGKARYRYVEYPCKRKSNSVDTMSEDE
jgi:hypothetical protein